MITEDLGFFFRDFGIEAIFGTETALVIFDAPSTFDMSDLVTADDYKMSFPSNLLTGLKAQSRITINNTAFVVRSVRLVGDGKIKEAFLSEVIG